MTQQSMYKKSDIKQQLHHQNDNLFIYIFIYTHLLLQLHCYVADLTI